MWAVIVLLIVLILSVVALLIAYFDLRDTVKIMQSTIVLEIVGYFFCVFGPEALPPFIFVFLLRKIARRLTRMSSAFDGSLPMAND